jgi:uncharacterized membrane-anchored protein YhcB (DUF1043 family)
MALLIAIGSLTAGVIIGVIATYRFSSTSPVKVRQLEQQIEDLQQTHQAYRENVSTHFNTTAELIQQMTESYKDVYQHLATGAQTLCDHEVADKMLPASERDRLFREDPPDTGNSADSDRGTGESAEPEPPRDYADRASGGGALSEEYGLGKSGTTDEPAGSTDSANKKPAASDDSPDGNGNTPDTDDDSRTETAAGETPRQPDDSTDPDAPYRRPATAGDGEPESSGDVTDKGTESPKKDSAYKG